LASSLCSSRSPVRTRRGALGVYPAPIFFPAGSLLFFLSGPPALRRTI